MLDILDESGRVSGSAERSRVHREGLRHRAVHLVVLDGAGRRMLLQKRSSAKDTCPGMWDTSVGGHVGAGEDQLEAVLREAAEELGLRLDAEDLESAGVHDVELPGDREHVTSWFVRHEGPFQPDPSEVETVEWYDAPAIESMVQRGACTPNFVIQWRAWLSMRLPR
jgi:16S rRNA (adenine1518-N6/adenine1519-N6)-dimethyltransferase